MTRNIAYILFIWKWNSKIPVEKGDKDFYTSEARLIFILRYIME